MYRENLQTTPIEGFLKILNILLGAQSAPPIYSSGYPGMRDHYERRAELQKEVHKTLIKTKYDRLVAFQEKISKEIDDLEKAAGEVGIRVKKPNPPEPSSEEPKPKLK